MHIHICVVHSLRLPPHVSYLLSFQQIVYKHPLLFTGSSTCIVWLRFLYGWFLFLVASVPLWTILQRTRTISQWVASATTMVCCNMSHKAIQSDSCLAEFLPTHSTGSYDRPNWQIICHRCTAGCIGQWVCYIFPQVAQAHSWWLRRHTVVGKYLIDP
jgi:hypothetical protein